MPNPRCKTSSHPYLKSLCNNYYKQGPSNADPPPAKPTQATAQGPKHRKATVGSYELNQRYPIPSNSTESSKQHKAGSEHLSQQARTEPDAYANRLHKGRCLRTPHQLQANVRKLYPNEASQQEESNDTTLTSIGVVYHWQLKKIRTRPSSLLNLTADRNWEQIHRQLKLSQLIFPIANRSCNRSHSTPQQRSLKLNDVAESYCRNWTRHPLLTAKQLTNICSQRNNRSLTLLKTNDAYC
ncbi:hypothetical protein F511_25300 [Dorcoceras hygrometricum]|uniref:Uncharacterized protein n=1 Tax=Dorcoceras hygrometricum TaxID=472368 RepID=A0A2Z7CV13_9LAMI|nr:hypothetical protein F511_25300 [Dorcoceras hygrometricum]